MLLNRDGNQNHTTYSAESNTRNTIYCWTKCPSHRAKAEDLAKCGVFCYILPPLHLCAPLQIRKMLLNTVTNGFRAGERRRYRFDKAALRSVRTSVFNVRHRHSDWCAPNANVIPQNKNLCKQIISLKVFSRSGKPLYAGKNCQRNMNFWQNNYYFRKNDTKKTHECDCVSYPCDFPCVFPCVFYHTAP